MCAPYLPATRFRTNSEEPHKLETGASAQQIFYFCLYSWNWFITKSVCANVQQNKTFKKYDCYHVNTHIYTLHIWYKLNKPSKCNLWGCVVKEGWGSGPSRLYTISRFCYFFFLRGIALQIKQERGAAKSLIWRNRIPILN